MSNARKLFRSAKAGFTLAEMMVVIVIIGLLATLIVPNVIDKFFTAQTTKAVAEIRILMDAIDSYTINNNGRAPTSLDQLVEADEKGHTYLRQSSVPKDPWGNEYVYEPPRGGQKLRILSYGKDGTPGGEGDDADIDSSTF